MELLELLDVSGTAVNLQSSPLSFDVQACSLNFQTQLCS